MSCKELDRPDPLVYIRRTSGGGVGGVIYAWDYYLMASLPTNDNVRYSRHENADGSVGIPLHEINNNRYNDVVCKATHLAYRIGGFARSAPIAIGDAKNEIDKKKETTDNGCILMIVSSSNFYTRLPECWPWSCRRWTAESSGVIKKTGKQNNDKEDLYTSEQIITWYKEDDSGSKVQVDQYTYSGDETWGQISDKIPKINIVGSIEGVSYLIKQKKIFKVTKDTYSSDVSIIAQDANIKMKNITMMEQGVPSPMAGAMFESSVYKTAEKDENEEYIPFDEDTLNLCNCDSGTKEIKIGIEIFPVLCNGTCKLVIKYGFLCYNTINGAPSGGRSTKKLISPFWSCRINETIELFNEEHPERQLIGTAEITLDGTDLQEKESFGLPKNPNALYVITGQDYYHDKINNRLYQIPYNISDGPGKTIYYSKNSGESFGKSPTYLSAHSSCCVYCKTVKDKIITYSNNLYCYALDPECDGDPYEIHDNACPTT
jgi:hypothetical protein